MKLLVVVFVLLLSGCASITESSNATVIWTFFGDIPEREQDNENENEEPEVEQ